MFDKRIITNTSKDTIDPAIKALGIVIVLFDNAPKNPKTVIRNQTDHPGCSFNLLK